MDESDTGSTNLWSGFVRIAMMVAAPTRRRHRLVGGLGDAFLQDLIERALGDRYGYGQGREGFAEISVRFYEKPSGDTVEAGGSGGSSSAGRGSVPISRGRM